MPLSTLIYDIFHRRRSNHELDEELQDHIARETEQNIRLGMTPAEARRQALLSFGGVDAVTEECRDQRHTRWFDSILHDVRFALRSVRRNPGFAIIAVITLSLGIGANTAIFSVVYSTLIRPLPYGNASRLITFRGNQSLPDTLDVGQASRTLENMGNFADWQFAMMVNSKPIEVKAAIVGGNVFPALGVNAAMGRYFGQAENDRKVPVVVVSNGFWQRFLNSDAHVLGRKLELSGNIFEIIGVMPKSFAFPHSESELWVPFTVGYPEAVNARGAHFTSAIGNLRPGVSLAQAQSELDIIGAELAKLHPEEARKFTVMPLNDRLVSAVRAPLLLLFGAVSLVLLIACVNYSSLLMARTAGRTREFQVRMALGAARWRVVRQIVTESVVVSIIGALLGTALAAIGTRLLLDLKPKEITGLNADVFSTTTLLFAIAISVVCGVLSALAPALQLFTRYASFREEAATSTKRGRAMSAFVVAECAMALVLLAGAGVLLHSFWRLMKVDPGFNSSQLLTMRVTLPAMRYHDVPSQLDFLTRLDENLHRVAGIQSAGIVSELPMTGSHMEHNMVIKGQPEVPVGQEPEISAHEASPDYFNTMQIPVLNGRVFNVRDTATSPPVAVITRAMADQYFKGENPIGAQIAWARVPQRVWMTIVGVVGDIRHDGLDDQAYPAVYTPLTQKQMAWKRFSSIVVRTVTTDPMSVAPAVQQAVWTADPQLPVTFVEPMSAVMAESLAERRFTTVLLIAFAGLALTLAIVGLYGVTSYMVTQRTQEIGVRIALGANPLTVLRMIISQAVVLSIIGVVIGTIGALWVLRLARALLFEVRSSDPLSLAAAGLMLVIVAGLACYWPARRAARIDPMRALRVE